MADKTKKVGRPKNVPAKDVETNEQETERLEMANSSSSKDKTVTIEDLSAQ